MPRWLVLLSLVFVFSFRARAGISIPNTYYCSSNNFSINISLADVATNVVDYTINGVQASSDLYNTFIFCCTSNPQIQFFPPFAGTYVFHYYDISISGHENDQYITVYYYPNPTVTISGVDTVCWVGGNTHSAVLTAVGSPAGGTYSWTGGSSTATDSVTYNSSTIYSVQYSFAGCNVSAQAAMVVNSALNPQINTATTAVCGGTELVCTARVNGGQPPYSYIWSTPNVYSNNDTADFITSASGGNIYTVSVTDAYRCTATTSDTILSFLNPNANFSVAAIHPCADSVFSFSSAFEPSGDITKSWIWGDGTITIDSSSLIVHAFSDTELTPHHVHLIATSLHGCGADTSTQIVIVYPNPKAGITVKSLDGPCISSQFLFRDSSTVRSGYISSYYWSLGAGYYSSRADTGIYYPSPGSYTIYHHIETAQGCGSDTAVNVFVDSLPLVAIQNSYHSDSICSGIPILLSTGINPSDYRYAWSTGDTTVSIGISNNTPGTGHYRVTVTDTYGCGSFDARTISVFPSPDSVSILYSNSFFCIGSMGDLFTIANPQIGYNYLWTSVPAGLAIDGANSISSIVNMPQYTTPVDIIATARIYPFGCQKSDTLHISMSNNNAPLASVIHNGSSLVCTNNAVASYQWGYTLISNGYVDSILIGETQQLYLFQTSLDTAKYYWVMITDSNGCSSKIYYNAPSDILNTIDELHGSDIIRIFPNPFTADLNIISETSSIISVDVYTLSGQHIVHNNSDHQGTPSVCRQTNLDTC